MGDEVIPLDFNLLFYILEFESLALFVTVVAHKCAAHSGSLLCSL